MGRLLLFAVAAVSACGLFPSVDGLGGTDADALGDARGDVTELPDVASDVAPGEASVHYERTITIQTQGALPAGYTIGVAFPDTELQAAVSAGKMRSDYADLRVRGASGERDRLLDAPPLARVVWFSLAAPIGANTTDTSYVVTYGDPNASAPPASGAAVFGFYDDFGGTSVDGSRWSSQGATSVSGSLLTLPAGGLGALTTLPLDPQTTVEWRAQVADPTSAPDGNTGFYYWFGFQHTGDFDASPPWIVWIARDKNVIGAEDDADGCPNVCGNTPGVQNAQFRLYGIERQPSLTIFSLDGAKAYSTAATNDQPLSLMIRNWLVSSDVVVDWMRARTRVYPEPTVTLGPEQTL